MTLILYWFWDDFLYLFLDKHKLHVVNKNTNTNTAEDKGGGVCRAAVKQHPSSEVVDECEREGWHFAQAPSPRQRIFHGPARLPWRHRWHPQADQLSEVPVYSLGSCRCSDWVYWEGVHSCPLYSLICLIDIDGWKSEGYIMSSCYISVNKSKFV